MPNVRLICRNPYFKGVDNVEFKPLVLEDGSKVSVGVAKSAQKATSMLAKHNFLARLDPVDEEEGGDSGKDGDDGSKNENDSDA